MVMLCYFMCCILTQVPRVSSFHPMFELQLSRREEKCSEYINWINNRFWAYRDEYKYHEPDTGNLIRKTKWKIVIKQIKLYMYLYRTYKYLLYTLDLACSTWNLSTFLTERCRWPLLQLISSVRRSHHPAVCDVTSTPKQSKSRRHANGIIRKMAKYLDRVDFDTIATGLYAYASRKLVTYLLVLWLFFIL